MTNRPTRQKGELGNRKEKLPAFRFRPAIFSHPHVFIAIVLTWIFWGPLWEGGTLIGGDLFPYFFPQKVFLADQLRAGVIPLWNPLTGDGYPTIAESQTGVCYPPDLLAYRWLSVTMAYNVIQITHYIFGFCGTWLLARKLGATTAGALLAAVSFIYGWFPTRICLEWAIITGSYLPWVMWCVESYLQQPRRRFLIGLCALLTMQLLAGHFHLAFITQLTLGLYALLRWWLLLPDGRSLLPCLGGEGGRRPDEGVVLERHPMNSGPLTLALSPAAGERGPEKKSRAAWWPLWAAILVSFFLAAVQVLPTWELKQRSQRESVSAEHQPGYGHLPPRYWTQAVVPWLWYRPGLAETLNQLPRYSGGAGTNLVEAHLYFGLLPLLCAACGLVMIARSRSEFDRVLKLWFWLGVAFLLYTPGWFLPFTQYLPGFNFFRGPGRYGIVTALAVALLAGVFFSRWLSRLPRSMSFVVACLVLGVTTMELYSVAQLVGYSRPLSQPVAERRADSPLRKHLAQIPEPVRLFAPMANVANLLDVSSTPVYLGIGPAEYFDPQFTLPTGPAGGLDPKGDPAQVAWLEQAGVTHILSLERMNPQRWPVELVWSGADPLLTTVFGRSPQEPFYLYRFQPGTGRVVWETANSAASCEVVSSAAHRVAITCDSAEEGRVILRDLDYPGWVVTVDGQPAVAERHGMFRAVSVSAGRHEIVWSYRPGSVFWGLIISITTLLVASAALFWRVRTAR